MYQNIPDFYFDESYPKLYEKIENAKAVSVSVDNEHGSAISYMMLREIPIDTDEKYYDLITPYGYGGPIITSLTGDKAALVDSFRLEMEKFCKDNNVVSEFVRFHPILNNAADFESIYNPTWDRKTVGTNVRDYEISEEFSKSTKKYIKKALKAGVTYEVIENPSEIDEFKTVYYSTMDRDSASDYYYFGDEYFQQILDTLGKYVIYVKVLFEDKLIAAGLYFACGDIVQCHLSGTLSEYLSMSPAYVTKYATAEWAKEHGMHFVHYGGGTSRAEDNSLYLFKKKFGQNTDFDFYLGRKIWNKEVYDRLCEIKGVDKDSDFFPAYRQ
ncbi:MAG: GNAT family N-acetyltransferase [Firmicutes bacterium]|nr:GNAT family N-acetyltransferase [Bacillota bacterium]